MGEPRREKRTEVAGRAREGRGEGLLVPRPVSPPREVEVLRVWRELPVSQLMNGLLGPRWQQEGHALMEPTVWERAWTLLSPSCLSLS